MAPRKKRISDVIARITEDGRLRYSNREELAPEDAPDDGETPDDRSALTGNQLVAYNLQRARRSRGWNQAVLGAQLERITGRMWSKASVSAAESSWRGGRARRFDANELLAFSVVFGLPIAYFFLPPDEPDLDESVFLAETPNEVGIPVVSREGLLAAVENPARPREFADRVARENERLGRGLQPQVPSVPVTPETVHWLLAQLREAGAPVDDPIDLSKDER